MSEAPNLSASVGQLTRLSANGVRLKGAGVFSPLRHRSMYSFSSWLNLASESSGDRLAPARRAMSCVFQPVARQPFARFAPYDHLRPAISQATLPCSSVTEPLISMACFARHPAGLKVKTQVSPVRWLADRFNARTQTPALRALTDDKVSVVVDRWGADDDV